jgi:hypothetical protein
MRDRRQASRYASRARRRRRLAAAVAILFALVAAALLLGLLVTSGTPWAEERPVPTAEQVGAGRDAVLQLRAGRTDPAGLSHLRLGPAQLDGFAALASHGFRPDRLELSLQQGVLNVVGSHRLWGGRWLNVGLVTSGQSTGFPRTQMTIGSIALGPRPSRWLFQLARWGLNRRGVRMPALDAMVRDVRIGPDIVTATIFLPRNSGLVDRLAGAGTDTVDEGLVVSTYCRLADAQRARPDGNFATQVQRAFLHRGPETPEDFNKAAFVALAMLIVDERAGDLAGKARALTHTCRIAPVTVSIHGRHDLPKHWILSAAFSVSAGSQFAQAIGEWKELADSLSRQSSFARGDPSGFSFVDLAADRAGFRLAKTAAEPADAARIAAQLASATAQGLLPVSLLERPESLTNAEFVRRFGGIDDPRYRAAVKRIDQVLKRDAIR